MSNPMLQQRLSGGLLFLTLNRPEALNALCAPLFAELQTALDEAKRNAAVAGVILTGSGKSFCAGADISEMLPLAPPDAADFAERGQRLMFSVEELGKPVVAAVNGYALGGGLELALACDFIIASENASFAFPEVKLGILPGFGGTQRLSRLVGKGMAKQLILSGERIDAAEALRIGLANRVVPAERLLDEVEGLMTTICSRGALSLKLAKEVIDTAFDLDLPAACRMERDAFALCFSSPDQKEGMGAFLEKRPADFRRG